MLDIAEELDRWAREGRDFAVATVVAVGGSAPRGPGAALAVDGHGTAIGSVSGGCVEAAVYDLCVQALQDGEAVRERFGYSDEDAFAVGLTCGGVVDVLVTPVRGDAPDRAVVAAALAAAAGAGPPPWPGWSRARPDASAEPCSYAPTDRTKGASAGCPASTARPWPRPTPSWRRGAPGSSDSGRQGSAVRREGSPCSWSRACRRPA